MGKNGGRSLHIVSGSNARTIVPSLLLSIRPRPDGVGNLCCRRSVTLPLSVPRARLSAGQTRLQYEELEGIVEVLIRARILCAFAVVVIATCTIATYFYGRHSLCPCELA